jgi:hypothetical protein
MFFKCGSGCWMCVHVKASPRNNINVDPNRLHDFKILFILKTNKVYFEFSLYRYPSCDGAS